MISQIDCIATGQEPKLVNSKFFEIFSKDSEVAVLSIEIFVPELPTSTPKP
jgi:hypothetical protein